MPDGTTAPRRKKLIEVSIPLEAINACSKKQKAPKGYPTAIHQYWAPRPIAACRGVLFAQLVDDPCSWPDRFPTPEAVDAERRRLHRLIGGTKEADYKDGLVAWESSNDARILNAAGWEIARSVAWGLGEEPPGKDDPQAVLDYLQTKAPPVYDPFSGGGSIPLEAQRLGLRAFGSDLNPVAVLIGKALVEIPPKFAGRPPVNPDADPHRHWKGAQGLTEDVRFYGRWMREEAEKRIGHLYPKARLADGTEATVVAWLWARTVRSPDPAAKGAMVPLVSSFMLSTKTGRKAWVEPAIDPAAQDGWRFEVRTGPLTKAEEDRLKAGCVSRSGGGTCILSGAAMPFRYLRAEADAGRFGSRLMAIVAEGNRSRVYGSPNALHEDTARVARPEFDDAEICHWPGRTNVVEYGMKTFGALFTPRQLVALTTFSDLVGEARARARADAARANLSDDPRPLHAGGAGAEAHADAVATYLAMLVDRFANYGSSISTWLPDDNAIRSTFGRQAIPMTWDFCEGNCFGASSAAWNTIINTVSAVLEKTYPVAPGSVRSVDAPSNNYGLAPCAINTDPPYYDNIGYADLSDFFYVWLRRSLREIWPDLFRRLTTPKAEELVATPYRHGGGDNAEAFFMQGMSRALEAMGDAAAANVPLIIYYAFKQSETGAEGTTSAGWASFLQAVVDSGLVVDGTWPLRTESAGRLIGRGANALASSIVLVCRNRQSRASIVTRTDFLRALRRELPGAIEEIRKAGVGPVDMQQSVIGPGMGVFSRHAKVLEDDDRAMNVKTALALINRVWGEIESETEAAFDAETQVALAWFETYGFDSRPSGELITLANAKNVLLNALFASGVFSDGRGNACLTPRNSLPVGWSPATDRTLTVWECAQHVARALAAEDGGADAAARLIAEMGTREVEARTLAHRLFQIATNRGWAQEALVWNELAQEWPRLEERAAGLSGGPEPAPAQGVLL